MTEDRSKHPTLAESKRGSLAKLAQRILTYSTDNRLGDRMQVLLYGVVEGISAAELQQRLGTDLAQTKLAFRAVTGEDVDAVAQRLLEATD